MNATVSITKPSLHQRVFDVLSKFRLIPRIETYPSVVSFAQTPLGRIILLALFSRGLRVFLPNWRSTLIIVLFIALMTFLPEHRRLVLALGSFALLVKEEHWNPLLLCLDMAVIALGVLLYWSAMRWPKSHFGQRPIAFLLTGLTVLILSASAAAPQSFSYSILWPLVGAAVSYVWFIAYVLTDRNSRPAKDLTLELTALRPLWGSTNTPFPKGAAYLRRIEAQNPEQLAVVQLKGLKLLAWAILLAVFQGLWLNFFHGKLRIPTADQALAMSVQGSPVVWHLRWESLILGFFESILTMAGFNALRNTYRPLSSRTIAEFFNRFYYYFKELLVDFFFYPVFLRYWKGHRRLRMVCATFAAAFFGNAFYHFTRDWQIIRDKGLWITSANFESYLLYCFILALGLSISQLRKRAPRPGSIIRGTLFPVLGVCLFFCLLSIFDSTVKDYPFVEHMRFFASLFFIRF
jgi:hypothetical protein